MTCNTPMASTEAILDRHVGPWRRRSGRGAVVAPILLLLALSFSAKAAHGRSHFGRHVSVPDVVKRLLPAVVSINTRHITRDDAGQPLSSRGMGSGVIVARGGYILTNYHIVEDADAIKVTLSDERTFRATVAGVDPFTDLAVIKIDGGRLPVARLGTSARLRVGETVIAIGNALWLEGGPSVTVGVVSALKRSMEQDGLPVLHHLIQTDAAINPGNSGGALVNLAGEVVGINTALIPSAHGIGFAIPMATVRTVLPTLIKGGRIVRPSLGVSAVSVTPQVAYVNDLSVDRGVFLMYVDPRGPADGAGLRPGDVIAAVGPTTVRDLHEFHDALAGHDIGEEVSLAVWRRTERVTVRAVLGEYR